MSERSRNQGPVEGDIGDDAPRLDHAIPPAIVVALTRALILEQEACKTGARSDGRMSFGSTERLDVCVGDRHAAPKQWMLLCLCLGF